MSMMDFNDAEPQRAGGGGSIIPEDTILLVVSKLRARGAGPGGFLKASDKGCEMMDLEFIVDGGEHDRRKLWEHWVTGGVTDGHEKAARITRSRCRAMLESAYGIDPTDSSEAAQKKRQVTSWGAFDGVRFCVRVGVESGGIKNAATGERYADKNVIAEIVTPDNSEYISPGAQQAPSAQALHRQALSGAATQSGPGIKPDWARGNPGKAA